MAPSSSKEEQGKEEADTVAPAAAHEQQKDVDSSIPDEWAKEKIEEALSSLGSYRVRCSELLEEAAPGRRVMGDDLELRCLEFLEQELSYIVACLTALSPQHADGEMEWLQELTRIASFTLPPVLDEADPQRHTLLRRAARCLRRTHRHRQDLILAAGQFYRLAEYRLFRYGNLLLRLGLPPQAEEGGVDRFQRSAPPSRDFPFQINVLTLYMSMFPSGYKFKKDQLVTKWYWEGIITRDQWEDFFSQSRVWEGAEDHFTYLVDRNIITRAASNSRRNIIPDEAESWQWEVSDSVYQFLASKSAEFGFHFTSATLNLAAAPAPDHGNQASKIPRRLALHHDDPIIPSLLQRIDLSQIRSLAVSGAVNGFPVDKFVNLVVLDVEGWENFGDDDLLKVCTSKMFFLRYLSIRNTRVSKLPPEIKELHSLKVLDASNTQITELPLQVFVQRYVTRLDLTGTPIRQLTLPKQTLQLQDSLHVLLLGGEGVINSAETATIVPHDIWRFWFLKTLATIDLSEQPASLVKALGDLECLRVLAITWSFYQSSDRDSCEALLSSIKKWEQLESLTIHCGLGCSMEFLGSLSHMSSHLKTFKVTLGRFAGVPQWFHGLKYLSFVQITICKLEARDLEILRGLRKLKCLILGLDFIPQQAIVIKNEGFLELQRFSIDCPVPWLTFELEAMPKLTYLQLDFRAYPMSLIRVPLGISDLPSLKEVALWYNARYANSSSIKMTVKAVREEVAKRRNTTKMISLSINGIEQDDEAVDEETNNTTGTPSGTNAGAGDAVEIVDEITEA